MSDYLLVKIAHDLDHLPGEPTRTTRPSVFRKLRMVPGVEEVNDMEVISPQTYEEWMLPREESLVRKPRERKTNVPGTKANRIHPAANRD